MDIGRVPLAPMEYVLIKMDRDGRADNIDVPLAA